jgi:hypothetical protein
MEGTGTRVVIGLTGLSRSGPLLPSSYTPFGILRVDPGRRLFSMAPTSFQIGAATVVSPAEPGVIVDEKARTLVTRTTQSADELIAAFAKFSGSYEAAGLSIQAPAAVATREAVGVVRIELSNAK